MIGNLEHCLDTITRQSGVSRQEALDILEKVADRAEEMRRTGTPDAAVAAAGKLSEEFRAKAEQDRLDAIRNATARAEITARINQEAGDRVAPGVSANLIPSKSLIPRLWDFGEARPRHRRWPAVDPPLGAGRRTQG